MRLENLGKDVRLDDGSEQHYITVEVPAGWTVTPEAGSGWTANYAGDGVTVISYTIEVTDAAAGFVTVASDGSVTATGLAFAPPADSDVDADVTVTATTVENGSEGAVAVAQAETSARNNFV